MTHTRFTDIELDSQSDYELDLDIEEDNVWVRTYE